MLKFFSNLILLLLTCSLLVYCNTATPENYFDRAVLNSNMLVGFAGNGMQRELDEPSMKMVNGDKDHPVSMTRKETMDQKIEFLEGDLKKVKNLRETDETKEMLQTAIALREHVLQVYKNEYQQLAKLYDDKRSTEDIETLTQSIHDKYYARFEELYNKLIAIGKTYAAKHDIKVNWGQ